MVAMTKTIARAYASEEILAFAICPGFTMTGMAEDYLESRGGNKLLAGYPARPCGPARGNCFHGQILRTGSALRR